MKTLDITAAVLLLIGGLNWGLVGIFDFNLVAALFGEMTALTRIIYTLVGLSALYLIASWMALPRRWAVPARQEPAREDRPAGSRARTR